MKSSEKRWIAILAIVAVIIIIGVIIVKNAKNSENESNTVKEEYVEKLEDGTKINQSKKLKETKRIEGIEISDIQLTESNNVSLLIGTITNTSNIEQGGYMVEIKVLDKNKNEITTLGGYIKKLKPGESDQFSTNKTFDFANAYDIEIEKK